MATGLDCLSKTLRMLLLTYTSNTNALNLPLQQAVYYF